MSGYKFILAHTGAILKRKFIIAKMHILTNIQKCGFNQRIGLERN